MILLFSLPVILSYLLQQVYSISDAAIVGQTLTAAEVAGVNDTNSLRAAIFMHFVMQEIQQLIDIVESHLSIISRLLILPSSNRGR